MKAWRVEQHGGPEVLELEDVSLRPLETDEARIRIQAVALNHLDLWVRKGVPGHRFPLPLTLGCDFSGEVCELGPLTDKTEEWLNRHHIEEQTSVVVDPVLSCGKCTVCEAGNTALCKEFGLLGETTDGGLSGYANVPIKNLVVKPQNLTYAEAASLPIAYVTAWNMLVHKAEAKKGDIVFIRAAGSGAVSYTHLTLPTSG